MQIRNLMITYAIRYLIPVILSIAMTSGQELPKFLSHETGGLPHQESDIDTKVQAFSTHVELQTTGPLINTSSVGADHGMPASNLPIPINRAPSTENAGEIAVDSLILSNDYTDFPGTFWLGETIRFTPETMDGRPMLRQAGNPDDNSHYIYTNSSVYYGRWDFSVRFDGFTTSNQNRVWVWLLVDDPESPNGYAVRIGESGGMKFARLFRMHGPDTPIELLQSARVLPDDHQEFRVRVVRNADGLWRLGVKTSYDTTYQWSEAPDAAPPSFAPFFGFRTAFTRTRADRFLFGPVTITRAPLFVHSARPIGNQIIEITFSEPPEPGTLNMNDIRILKSDSGEIAARATRIERNGFHAILHLEQSLAGGSYRLEIDRYTDVRTGKSMPATTLPMMIFDEVETGDVRINEITPKTGTGELVPFIELYNRSEKLINASGWKLRRQQLIADIPDFTLEPGAMVILTRSQNVPFFADQESVVAVSLPSLSRVQDTIWLQDDRGLTIDSIAYHTTNTVGLADGQSLERINASYSGLDARNWLRNQNGFHSAGLTNTASQRTLPDLSLLNAVLRPDKHIEATFNLFIQNDSGTELHINGNEPTSIRIDPEKPNILLLEVPDESHWPGNTPGMLEITGVRRYGDARRYDFSMEAAQPPEPGDLLINEILYQPLQGRYSTHPDQSEFVEILNQRSYALDMQGLFLADTPDRDGQIRTWDPVGSQLWRIQANGFGVVHADTATNWQETRIASFFGIPDHGGIVRVDRSTLGLTSSGRGVYLRNHETVFDSVYYSPDWHHPYVYDPRGRSLERVYTAAEVTASWGTSAASSGATPSETNSIALQKLNPQVGAAEPGLKIDPNPYSPDLDGHEDHAVIQIQPPGIGYLLRLQIFDRYGRYITTLVDDELVGGRYQTLWRGTDRQNILQPTGVYIVYAELHHPEKPGMHFKEPLVLVRRR